MEDKNNNATFDEAADDLFRSMSPEDEEAAEKSKELEKQKATMSPLDRALLEKDSPKKGVVVNNADLKADYSKAPKMTPDNKRMDAAGDTINEMDMTIERQKHLVRIKAVKTPQDYTAAIAEINSVTWDPQNKRYFMRDDEGRISYSGTYYRLKTPKEEATGKVEGEITDGASLDEVAAKADEKIDQEAAKAENNRKKLVEVIIKNSHIGEVINFSPEEKAKMYESETIHVNKFIDVSLSEAPIIDDNLLSFSDAIQEYNYRSAAAERVAFPASGFSAEMKGLTMGELSDIIILDPDNISPEDERKRLSVIYDKMTNLSIEPFKNFDEFVRGFAYTDINLAVYGLLCSTFPSIQKTVFECGEPNCKAEFEHAYVPKDLLQLGSAEAPFINMISELEKNDPAINEECRRRCGLVNNRVLKMPITGIEIEYGIGSAYHHMEWFLPIGTEERYKARYPEDTRLTYQAYSYLLRVVKAVRLEDPKTGAKRRFSDFESVWEALKRLAPDEFLILISIARRINRVYTPIFAWTNITCTSCGYVTPMSPVEITSIAFQLASRQLERSTDVSSLLPSWM